MQLSDILCISARLGRKSRAPAKSCSRVTNIEALEEFWIAGDPYRAARNVCLFV